MKTPQTDDLARGNHVVPTEWAEQLARERDQARADADRNADILSGLELRSTDELARLERDEAQNELSSIHRWIERNHADGFIDSLTYFQNLERVTDNWYDRLDRLEIDANRFERERDEARARLHPDRALEWLRVHYQAWFGDRTEWSDDIADRFYKDTATLTLFCQNFKFSKEGAK